MNANRSRRLWMAAELERILGEHAQPETIARLRKDLDERAMQVAASYADHTVETRWAAADYQAMENRRRSQLARRTLDRLVKDGKAVQTMGPGDIGDNVRLYQLAQQEAQLQISVNEDAGQVAKLRLQLAQQELAHQATLKELRVYFGELCEHVAEVSGCPACQGFARAGGEFEEATA